jgi:hypothetical protein
MKSESLRRFPLGKTTVDFPAFKRVYTVGFFSGFPCFEYDGGGLDEAIPFFFFGFLEDLDAAENK